MVVNREGKFVTGRTHPLLTQVKCEVNEFDAVFTFLKNEELPKLKVVFSDIEKKPARRVR